MQNAIMQSKLEFEQQKKNFVIKTSTEVSQGKKKKGKTMRLDEFLESNKETDHKDKGKFWNCLHDKVYKLLFLKMTHQS